MTALSRYLSACIGLTFAFATLVACDGGEDGEGTLEVTIYGEPFIEEGIPASEVSDGWSVSFSSFEVTVTDVAADGVLVDGSMDWQLAMDTEGRGQVFGSTTVPAGTVEHLDYRITAVHVVGVGEKAGNTVVFDWTFDTDTTYVNCETDQKVEDGGQATSQITIHADHLFYDDLVSDDPNVAFDLVASADTDGDGNVTEAELAALDISGEDRYQVGDLPVTDLWGFISAQTKTLGHIDGEGHCDTE